MDPSGRARLASCAETRITWASRRSSWPGALTWPGSTAPATPRLHPGNGLHRELPDRRHGRRHRHADAAWPPNRSGWASATSAASATAQEVIDLLELPPGFPRNRHDPGLARGRAAGTASLCLSAVLHWEKYERTPAGRSVGRVRPRDGRHGIYGGRQVPVPGKPDGHGGYGWTEHSRAAWPRRSGRPAEIIEKQGFALEVGRRRAT